MPHAQRDRSVPSIRKTGVASVFPLSAAHRGPSDRLLLLRLHTAGTVKLLLSPRQSREVSHVTKIEPMPNSSSADKYTHFNSFTSQSLK